jgi:hypothetical protein
MPSTEHYYELLKQAVYEGKEQSGAGYITAMTKAHLKDGAIDHALKFFESEVQKLGKVQEKREDLLIAMFDSVFGEVKAEESKMTYEQYKDKYLDMIQLSSTCLKEGYAVS